MAMLSQKTLSAPAGKKKISFMESQRLAKLRAYEKQSKTAKINLMQITMFTQQLSSMLSAGLPLVASLEALQDQTENKIFAIILRDIKQDISAGSNFSAAVKKYPRAFPNLFISMVEAGEASGALADIMGRVSEYFAESVKLEKKIKSAMTYPIAVISLSFILVQVLLIFVIPVFEDMFESFGKKLPAMTQALIDASNFMQSYWYIVIGVGFAFFKTLNKFVSTPKGRRIKDQTLAKIMIVGNLTRKVNVSRFCRTYATLLKSGVPILRTLEICSSASDNTYVEDACVAISRSISQGGQLSEVIAQTVYFPSMVKHMTKAGEQTGNIDGMMTKVADFYDDEVNNIVGSLTSLMEPIMIVVLGTIIGTIVIAMFLPIFQMTSVAF